MKKVLSTLFLTLTLLVGYAQNAVYARATTLNIGVKNNWTGEFEWSGPQVTENGVTIKIESSQVTINSQSPQRYTIYSESENVEVDGSNFFVSLSYDFKD